MQPPSISPQVRDLTIPHPHSRVRATASLQTDFSAHDHDIILVSTIHSSSRFRPPTTDHHILSNSLYAVRAPCHNVSAVLIACPLFSPLRARLLPDRLPKCLLKNKSSSKSTRPASLILRCSIGRSENSRTIFSFDTLTTGKAW